MPFTEQERESVRTFEKRFTTATGAVDLVALFDVLALHEGQTRFYIDVSRELRAEQPRASAAKT